MHHRTNTDRSVALSIEPNADILYSKQRWKGYRSTITRVIVTTPCTISTEPGSHVINAIRSTGSLRVRFAATQRQLPHRFCTEKPQNQPQPPNPNSYINQTLAQPTPKKRKTRKSTRNETRSSIGNTFETGIGARRAPFGLIPRVRPVPRRVATVQLHKTGSFFVFIFVFFLGKTMYKFTECYRKGKEGKLVCYCLLYRDRGGF